MNVKRNSNMLYKYDNEYKTLQQWDEHGILRSSMSMPKSDLNLIARLNIKENILRERLTRKKILRYNLDIARVAQ